MGYVFELSVEQTLLRRNKMILRMIVYVYMADIIVIEKYFWLKYAKIAIKYLS